jgi:hypothetical protein
MRNRFRFGVLTTAVATALGLAGTGLAAYDPSLVVSMGVNSAGAPTTDISFRQTNVDDPTFVVNIFTPLGISATLNQAPGTQIGTLEGQVIAGAFGGANVPVAGTIVTGDPTSPTFANSGCAQLMTPLSAVWLLNVTAAGQSLPAPVPLMVKAVTAPPVSAFASVWIRLCLPHPSMATFQIKLVSATLHLVGVYSPPSTAGSFRWSALNLPYGADGQSNPPASVQTQSITRQVEGTLTGKRSTKSRTVGKGKHRRVLRSYSARLRGSFTAGESPVANAAVDIFAGSKKVAGATTNANGSFSKTLPLTKTTKYKASVSTESHVLSGATCEPAIPFPGLGFTPRCGTITEAGFSATSNTVTVKKPKRT